MKPRITALVPMRHQSRRVKDKNHRLFDGRPLYHWIMETLLRCQSIDNIYIDTDSPLITREAPLLDARIKIIDRPEDLRSEMTPMNDILLHDVSVIGADHFLQTHSTNPMLKTETIEKAIERYLAPGEHDSLFSVTGMQKRLWTREGRPVNHNPEKLERTQDLRPLYEENSCIYVFSKKVMTETKNRIGRNPLLFEILKAEALDIDDEGDFEMAQILHRTERGNK